MNNTAVLTVNTNLYLKNEIVIHPNEGFDLGIMNTSMSVKIFANVDLTVFDDGHDQFIDGNISLKNECKAGTIQLCNNYWKKIGMPEKIKLYYDNCKVLIQSV